MKTLLALTVFLFLTFSVRAEDDLKALSKHLSTFYLSASADSFTRFQKEADRLDEKITKNDNKIGILVPVALARISAKHGWPVEAEGTVGQRARSILDGGSNLAKYIEDDNQVDGTKLDIWWVSFFSTGETAYLERILKCAGEPPPKDDLKRTLIIKAARWSFKSNCKQHEAVMAFAKTQLSSTTDPTLRGYLSECIRTQGE